MSTVNDIPRAMKAGVDRSRVHCDRRQHVWRREQIAVANGARIWVRPLERFDRDALVMTFERLSEWSRIQRFLGPKKLTDGDLAQLVAVDHLKREALVAIDPADGSIIGLVGYDISPSSDNVAELAGTVVDDWQGHGIGRELAARVIERARANGIVKLTASAFADNVAVLTLLRRLGFVRTSLSYGVSELQLELAVHLEHV